MLHDLKVGDLNWRPKPVIVLFSLGKKLRNLSSLTGVQKQHTSRYPGARFSKVPKLFGRISGDIILFVSSKRRYLEARSFAVVLIIIPFITYEKTSFTE